MKTIHPPLAGTLASTLLLALVATRAPAELRTAPPVAIAAEAPTPPIELSQGLAQSLAPAGVYFDEPGDGALWARGERYKLSFGREGATYYAGFGPRQPHNLPHALSPDHVTSGGAPIAFEATASAVRGGDRVEIDRGAFVEAYELAPESLEQLFVFPTLPSRGELVVHIPIASELEGVETDAGLEFRGELGRVTYSRAVAIDARGARTEAATQLVDGAITIRVPAAFLATAELPLVIDPVLNQFWLDSSTTDTFTPDLAWDPFHNVWLAVYAQTFSATDIDVFAKSLTATGATIASGFVDFTGAAWTRPRVANSGLAHQFLVVAERSSSIPKAVMGRIVTPNGTLITMGAQFDVGGSVGGDKLTPDVGGDPSTNAGSSFCVVFEQMITASDSEIGFRLVSAAGTPVGAGPTFFADGTVNRNGTPSLSRSNGGSTWLLAWVRAGTIRAARVQADGVVLTAPFGVTLPLNEVDSNPCASSPLASSQTCAIAFERRANVHGSVRDIYVSVLDGPSVLQTVNLTAMENSGRQAQEQREPSVDSDGQHFLVSYAEFEPVFGIYETYVSDLFLAGSQLGLSQSHLELHDGVGISQYLPQVAAKTTLSGESHRYGVIYEVGHIDVSAVLFDGLEGGNASSFCFGDGSVIDCPCGNNGSIGRGCANSVNANGALLTVTGTASTVDDTLRLQASGMPPSSTCLFFQGTGVDAPSLVGDGLLCVGGTAIRLATKSVALGAAQYPQPFTTDLPISVRGAVPLAGGSRSYQVWYRNSAAFCTGATFNLTSGIFVNWAR